MGKVLGFVGLLVVMGVGLYIFKQQAVNTAGPSGSASNPRATVDIMGVRNDLIAIANAERRRYASDGKYVEIQDLISNGDISMPKPERGPYSYAANVSDTGFKITATYSGNDPGVPKSINITDSMQITSE